MITISRTSLIAEELIREHIRGRIKHKLFEQTIKEQKLRKVVRQLLEVETGTEEPSKHTGINVLASLLEKIVPVIEDDYKMLTTSPEQRESFRNHMIQALKNALKPIDSAEKAEKIPEGFIFEIDAETLLEKMKIDMTPEGDDPGDEVEGEFIDIAEPEDDFVHIDDQNETGRNFAADTFKQKEKQTVEAYDMLADEEDQKLFYDYLITNLLLYFDKFEDELQTTLPDSTTPEYEEEKAEEEAEMATTEPETPEEPPAEEEAPLG